MYEPPCTWTALMSSPLSAGESARRGGKGGGGRRYKHSFVGIIYPMEHWCMATALCFGRDRWVGFSGTHTAILSFAAISSICPASSVILSCTTVLPGAKLTNCGDKELSLWHVRRCGYLMYLLVHLHLAINEAHKQQLGGHPIFYNLPHLDCVRVAEPLAQKRGKGLACFLRVLRSIVVEPGRGIHNVRTHGIARLRGHFNDNLGVRTSRNSCGMRTNEVN